MDKNVTVHNADKYSLCVIGTGPRSGTWFSAFIFKYLDQLLGEGAEVTEEVIYVTFSILENLKIIKLHGHLVCPGFIENPDIEKSSWEELNFHAISYNNVYHLVEKNPHIFIPTNNDKLRVVYIYRNPLDQCISMYNHHKNHVYEELAEKTKDVKPLEYAMKFGFESWIKQYLSYQEMQRICPNQIQFISYDKLVLNPFDTFSKMLEFIQPNHQISPELIEKSVELSAPTRIKKIEQKHERSLASDQTDPTLSHIKSPLPGNWKKYYSSQDIKKAEAYFSRFGLNLGDFQAE